MTASGGRRSRLIAVIAAAPLLFVAACSGAQAGNRPPAPPSPTVYPDAELSISPANASQNVWPDKGITVTAAGGKLTSVIVRTTGQTVIGSYSAAQTSWTSTWALQPASRYTVTATAMNPNGKSVTSTSTFMTLTPLNTFGAQTDINDGDQVGIGKPIDVTFDTPVYNQAEVERSLQVISDKPAVGAWHWFSSTSVQFRTRNWWPGYTNITLVAHLTGVRGAKDTYGTQDLVVHFHTGEALSSVTSVKTHRTWVYMNGKQIDNWPSSGGMPGLDTPNGHYLTMEKGNPVRMNSATFGIKPGNPLYYNVLVNFAVRFSWSGNYYHSAPWSVGEQGYSNVSHGCINLAPDHAEWWYNHAVPGIPVTIQGSPVDAAYGDGETQWFLTWAQWLRGSATGQSFQTDPDYIPPPPPLTPAATPTATATPGVTSSPTHS